MHTTLSCVLFVTCITLLSPALRRDPAPKWTCISKNKKKKKTKRKKKKAYEIKQTRIKKREKKRKREETNIIIRINKKSRTVEIESGGERDRKKPNIK